MIQSIPIPTPLDDRHAPLGLFRLYAFGGGHEGIVYFPARCVLDRGLGRPLLYHRLSHGHWASVAHWRAGEARACLVADELSPG